MMYYELLHAFQGRYSKEGMKPGIYVGNFGRMINPGMLAYHSARIWEETEDGVIYIKHTVSLDTPVDLQEFAWIKLKAKISVAT